MIVFGAGEIRRAAVGGWWQSPGDAPDLSALGHRQGSAASHPTIRHGILLRDDLANRHAKIDLQPLAAGDFQTPRVEAQLV